MLTCSAYLFRFVLLYGVVDRAQACSGQHVRSLLIYQRVQMCFDLQRSRAGRWCVRGEGGREQPWALRLWALRPSSRRVPDSGPGAGPHRTASKQGRLRPRPRRSLHRRARKPLFTERLQDQPLVKHRELPLSAFESW